MVIAKKQHSKAAILNQDFVKPEVAGVVIDFPFGGVPSLTQLVRTSGMTLIIFLCIGKVGIPTTAEGERAFLPQTTYVKDLLTNDSS